MCPIPQSQLVVQRLSRALCGTEGNMGHRNPLHFTCEETEVQREKAIYSRSQRKKVAGSKLKSKSFTSQPSVGSSSPLCKILEFFQEQKSAQVISLSQDEYQIYP